MYCPPRSRPHLLGGEGDDRLRLGRRAHYFDQRGQAAQHGERRPQVQSGEPTEQEADADGQHLQSVTRVSKPALAVALRVEL